ncbi:MAG: hypothetical protein DMF74_05145 [Acidobacteria bacterium]|nr:MAG: hypothetical protein DMF74_05145 [Acidobacteriota bacterium]
MIWCRVSGFRLIDLTGRLPGDYDPNFFGHAFNIVNHPDFGWLAFGGNVKVDGDWVSVQPLDSFRMRVYVASRGLWLTLDAGRFEAVEVNTRTHAIRIALSPQTPDTPQARLHVEQPAKVTGVGTYRPRLQLTTERDAYAIPLKRTTTWIELTDGK